MKESMSCHDRMYHSFSGKVPDRVPYLPKIWVDLACKITNTEFKSIINDPYAILEVMAKAYIEIGTDGFRQFHFPVRNLLEKEGKIYETKDGKEIVGELDLHGGLMTHLENPEYFNYEDPWFMAYNHYWSCKKPLIPNKQAAKKMKIPSKSFYKETGCENRQQEIIRKYGNKCAIIGDCDTGTMSFLVTMRGMEQALIDIILEPELVHSIMEKGAAYCIEKGKFNIDMGIKMLRLNDSVGNMSVISPAHWETFVFPHFKTICDELHHYDPDVRIYCHICGNVLPILEKLIETGVDCIGPLDPLGGFNPSTVREIVGNQVALLGGVNTLSFMNEDVDNIVAEARHCIETAGVHGGYILSSGCVIPRDSKVENIKALKNVVMEYGFYENGELIKSQEN